MIHIKLQPNEENIQSERAGSRMETPLRPPGREGAPDVPKR